MVQILGKNTWHPHDFGVRVLESNWVRFLVDSIIEGRTADPQEAWDIWFRDSEIIFTMVANGNCYH